MRKWGVFAAEAEEEGGFGLSPGEKVRIAQKPTWYFIAKLQARLHAGEIADALAASSRARELVWSIPERFELAEYHFYSALARAAAGDGLDSIREHHPQLARWAGDRAENFACPPAALASAIPLLHGK